MGTTAAKKQTIQFNSNINLKVRRRDIIIHYGFRMKLTIEDLQIFPNGLEGLKLWSADIISSRFAVLNSQRFKDKEVLCYKAGVGINGIVIKKWTNCKNIYMSEVTDDLVDNIRNNCEINGCKELLVFKLEFTVLP